MVIETSVGSLSEKQIIKYFLFLLLPIFAVVAGMNLLFPTTDSEQYEGFFKLISFENPFGEGPSDSHFELGFSLSAAFFKLVLNTSYYTWVVSIVGLSLILKFHVFQKFRNGFLAVLIYLFCLYTSNECIVVRASVAQSLCMFAFLYLDESKFKALFFLILAVLFHNSTVIFLLVIFIPKRIFLTRIKISWIIVAFILLIILKEIIIKVALGLPRFGPYFYDNPKYFNIWGVPRVLIALICVSVLTKLIDSKEVIQRYFLNISIIIVLVSAVTFDFSLLSIRLLDLALPIVLLLLLDKYNKRNKWIILILIILMISELFFTRIIGGPELVLDFLKN